MIRIFLNASSGLFLLELLQQFRAVGLHFQIAFNVSVSQILVRLLIGVLLDGFGFHRSIGEVLTVGFPRFIFGSAKNAGLLVKSLGDLGSGAVDGDDSVLFHGDNLLYIFDFVFSRGRVSLALFEISITWGKEKPVL